MELHTNGFVLVSTVGRLCLAEADTTVLAAYRAKLIQKRNVVLLNQITFNIICVMIKVKQGVDNIANQVQIFLCKVKLFGA